MLGRLAAPPSVLGRLSSAMQYMRCAYLNEIWVGSIYSASSVRGWRGPRGALRSPCSPSASRLRLA